MPVVLIEWVGGPDDGDTVLLNDPPPLLTDSARGFTFQLQHNKRPPRTDDVRLGVQRAQYLYQVIPGERV